MWIFLPNSMLSIVEKPGDVETGTLTVRGRVKGDIEKVFPNTKVATDTGTDYAFRAKIPREQVAKAMYDAVMGIGYPGFNRQMTGRMAIYAEKKFVDFSLVAYEIKKRPSGHYEIKGTLRR